MIFKKSLLVLVTVVILSASLFVSGCSRGRMQNTTETLDMSLSITTSAPTPAPTTAAKETTSIQTTTKSATTQAPTTQEATTAKASPTPKPTTQATTTARATPTPRPTTQATTVKATPTPVPTTQATTTAKPTPSTAPTTQATTTAKPTPTTAPTTTAVATFSKSEFLRRAFDETNKIRRENGGQDLVRGSDFHYDVADLRASEIAQHGHFSHTRPNGSHWFSAYEEVASKKGYSIDEFRACTVFGENIALSHVGQTTPELTVRSLASSQAHLYQMIDSEYDYLAIGFRQGTYKDSNGTYDVYYLVQIFYSYI